MFRAGASATNRVLPAAAKTVLTACLFVAAATAPATAQISRPEPEYTGSDRIEEWSGRRVLVVTPHPDDETFTSGGTLALLAANENDIQVVIYTTDNAGSRDPEMTKDRLKAIRRAEEEEACRILGIPKENIHWLGHDDGMLEYVDRRELTRQVAREIRRFRPHALFSVDPGSPYEQYHKSDHRSGAIITVDAIRAARWRLYFPELEAEGFEAWSVPLVLFYYSANPNYTVDITDTAEKKARAAAAHISQFGSLVDRYDPSIVDEQRKEWAARLLQRAEREDGRVVERFRRSEGY